MFLLFIKIKHITTTNTSTSIKIFTTELLEKLKFSIFSD